jgi:hypothetical protein
MECEDSLVGGDIDQDNLDISGSSAPPEGGSTLLKSQLRYLCLIRCRRFYLGRIGRLATDELAELHDAAPSGRLLGRQEELDYFSPLVHRNPFCTPPEINRNVKLNYSRHGSVLPIVCFSGKKTHAALVLSRVA